MCQIQKLSPEVSSSMFNRAISTPAADNCAFDLSNAVSAGFSSQNTLVIDFTSNTCYPYGSNAFRFSCYDGQGLLTTDCCTASQVQVLVYQSPGCANPAITSVPLTTSCASDPLHQGNNWKLVCPIMAGSLPPQPPPSPAPVDFELYYLNGLCSTPGNVLLAGSGVEGQCIQVFSASNNLKLALPSASVIISCSGPSTLYFDNSCRVPYSDTTALQAGMTNGCLPLSQDVTLNLFVNCSMPPGGWTTNAPVSTPAPSAPSIPTAPTPEAPISPTAPTPEAPIPTAPTPEAPIPTAPTPEAPISPTAPTPEAPISPTTVPTSVVPVSTSAPTASQPAYTMDLPIAFMHATALSFSVGQLFSPAASGLSSLLAGQNFTGFLSDYSGSSTISYQLGSVTLPYTSSVAFIYPAPVAISGVLKTLHVYSSTENSANTVYVAYSVADAAGER